MTTVNEANNLDAKKERGIRDYIGLVLKGMAMGASDVVPGVSGGTMAFILGIYQELLGSIKDVANPDLIKAIFSLNFKKVFEIVNWQFLLAVVAGNAQAVPTEEGAEPSEFGETAVELSFVAVADAYIAQDTPSSRWGAAPEGAPSAR